MTSSFDRRSTISTHHDLWIELGRIELAIEKNHQDGGDDDTAQAKTKERQLHLREALANLTP